MGLGRHGLCLLGAFGRELRHRQLAQALAELLAAPTTQDTADVDVDVEVLDVVAAAERLVEWANAQGGHDNITAALARYDPSLR